MRTPIGRLFRATAVALPAALIIAGLPSVPAQAVEQPTLGARVKQIINVDGLNFRDLNSNQVLDPYEDWRLPTEQRVADLVSQMTLREMAGLMLIDTLNSGCEGALLPQTDDYVNNQMMHRFIFRNTVTGPGTTVCNPDTGFRAGSTITPNEAATFMNSMQELGEGTRLGIPMLYKSNARNHIDPDARAGINESAGAMSSFPKEAGIAAATLGEQYLATGQTTVGDMGVVEDFAAVMGQEWSAIGLRGMYGYMADLSTEPRWYRTHETFTEDAGLAANIMATLVGTLQGPVDSNGVSLNPDTDVALTIKHFPGGGPQELGLDPHYSFGKTQVYPGDAFGYHLEPFQAAIDGGVAAIMPYYGVPMGVTYNGVTYSQTGFAFSDETINGLLREQLGFAGYVNSDTGIINDRAWGLETATVPQRVAAAINAGTDTLSGFHDVQTIIDLVDAGLVTPERVELAATRLLAPMFQMGLFENPYVDQTAADAIVGSEANRAVGMDLQRKSIVLLQNNTVITPAVTGMVSGSAASLESTVLPLKPGATVYILGDFNAERVASYGFTVIDGNQTPRPSAAGADYLLVSMTAKNQSTGSYDSQDPATGMNPAYTNPIVMPGVNGLDGQSPYGAADACNAYGAPACTDNGLRFGGSYPWESDILDFSGMSTSQSWQVVPGLDAIQQATAEIGDPNKVVLHVYFRQPFVLDEASGLRDSGAIVAGFGVSDTALMDVLSGRFAPQGKMPFALAGTRQAIIEQYSDLPGYAETTDGELYPFGFGLTYEQSVPTPSPSASAPAPSSPRPPDKPSKLPTTGVEGALGTTVLVGLLLASAAVARRRTRS